METHLSSFGQDRTEENGVVTFHLSQNGIGCFNQPSTAFPPFLDFLQSRFGYIGHARLIELVSYDNQDCLSDSRCMNVNCERENGVLPLQYGEFGMKFSLGFCC